MRVEPNDDLLSTSVPMTAATPGIICVRASGLLQLKQFLNYVAFLRSRLAAQILAGRLVIEQSIVARDLGTSSLTINMEWTEWSSAHEAGKASAGRHRTSFSLCAKEKSFCLRRPSRAGRGSTTVAN